jgi:predicted KAP-like P-loop ATPase
LDAALGDEEITTLDMNNGSTESRATRHRFCADRPINSRTEDCLSRAGFADSIAGSIQGWKGQDSLIIALYGAWGAGKSSIKNMVLESLRSGNADSIPTILEFNPWQWAGQDKLAEAFFQEIEIVIKGSRSPDVKKVAAQWRLYSARLRAVSFFSDKASQVISGALGFFLGTGATWSLFSSHPALVLLGTIGIAVLLIVLNAIPWISELVSRLSDVKQAGIELWTQSLENFKKSLREQMARLSKPIVVIIDDIDRLNAEEIRLLFQLVKANADFPNLVYVLLFQRDIVESALDSPPSIKGQEFLKKIVQVGFDIPRIERTRLEKVLFAGLNDLLADDKIGKHFDRQRWGNVFLGGLRPFFETLRDVYRYLATLSFHISLFRGAGSFEVNPIDLITLEVLRVFEPKVYQLLQDAKSELTDLLERRSGDAKVQLQTKSRIQSLVNQAKQSHRPQVQEIITQLFPPVDWVFGGLGYGSGSQDTWFRDKRVCHPDVFDRYFHLAIPLGDISQEELDRIISLICDREGLVMALRSLNERQLLGVALDRLEAYKETLDIKCAVPFVTALFDVGDELLELEGGVFAFASSPEIHATRIIHWYLKQEKEIRKRGQVLIQAAKATSGLYMAVSTASQEGNEERRKQHPDMYNMNMEDVKELQRICLQKIEQAGISGKLARNPHMLFILHAWRSWGGPDKPREWAEKLIGSKDGAISFLTACVSRTTSQGMSDYVSKVNWRINLKTIEEFVSVEALEKTVSEISLDVLPGKSQNAVKAFLKAINHHPKGESDDWMWDDDHEDS